MPEGYYDVPGLPYPKRPLPRAAELDPDDTAAIAAGAAPSAADRIRASVQRTGVPANYAENRFGTAEVDTRQPAGSVAVPPVRKIDANFDAKGNPIRPNYGAPGVHSFVKAVMPEALAGLESAAESGNVVHAKFGGQDIEYTPQKRVNPALAVALVREAVKKRQQAEQIAADERRFNQQVALAKIPGEQDLARLQMEGQLAEKQEAARRADPMYQERLAGMQAERGFRQQQQQLDLDAMKQRLTPRQQMQLQQLEMTVATGSPQERAAAQRAIDNMMGLFQERVGLIGSPTEYGRDYTPRATIQDEDKWRAALAPQLNQLERALGSGGWFSSNRTKVNAAIRMLRSRAARNQVPDDYVNELIAEYKSLHD